MQQGGEFFLSDDKIKEYSKLGLTSDTYSENKYKELTNFIIQNSTIIKLSRMATDNSLFGLIYKLTLKKGVKSPFVKLDINDSTPEHADGKCTLDQFNESVCMKPIDTFLMKLSFLDKAGETAIVNNLRRDFSKRTSAEKEFSKEAELQNKVYEKSYELGESIVPACMFPSYMDDIRMDNGNYNPIFNTLLNTQIDTDIYLKTLTNGATKNKITRFGVIIMEFAEGYRTMADILNDRTTINDDKHKAILQAKAAHLKLYECGYTHGDSHGANIMINLKYSGFLQPPNTGKALIIDFGRSQPIPKSDIITRKLPQKIGPDNYQTVLEYLNWISNQRGRTVHVPYEWIKKPIFREENIILQQILL
jgi:hypothetical protein